MAERRSSEYAQAHKSGGRPSYECTSDENTSMRSRHRSYLMASDENGDTQIR